MAAKKKTYDPETLPQSVLVLDGDESLVKMISGYMREMGSKNIVGVSDPAEASQQLGSQRFEMIILDWRLKNPPGEEIYKAIRRFPGYEGVPIILISGFVRKDDLWVMREDKRARFLVKPFTEEIITDLVSRTFGAVSKELRAGNAPQDDQQTEPTNQDTGHGIIIAKGETRTKGHGIQIVKHDEPLGNGTLVDKKNNTTDNGTYVDKREGSSDGFTATQGSGTHADNRGIVVVPSDAGPSSADIATDSPSFQINGTPRISEVSGTGKEDEAATASAAPSSGFSIATSNGNKSKEMTVNLDGPSAPRVPEALKEEAPKAGSGEALESKKDTPGFFNTALVDKISEFFGINESAPVPEPAANMTNAVKEANSQIDRLLSELMDEAQPLDGQNDLQDHAIAPGVRANMDAAAMLEKSRPILTKAYLVGDKLNVYVPDRALIVDPDLSHRKIIETYLHQVGVRDVQIRHQGDDAWETIRNEHFDLIVMDWRIKRVSGLTLYNRLRQQPNHAEIPVIVMAGFVDREDFRILTESHCTKFIEKPFLIEVFDAKLKETCRDASVQTRIIEFVIKLLDHAKDDPDQVVDITTKILEKVPSPFQFLLCAGRWLLTENKLDAAERVLEIALRLDSRSVSAMTELGKVWHFQNAPEKALPLIEKASQLSPQNVERLCLLGEVGLTFKDTFLARQYFKDALNIDPEQKTAQAGLILADNIDERLVEFDQRPVHLQFAGALNIVGITLARNGQIEKAVEQYKAAICFVHDNAALSRLRFNLGMAHLRGGELDQAELWFKRAREIAPADFKKASEYHRKTQDLLSGNSSQQLIRGDGAILNLIEGEEDLIA